MQAGNGGNSVGNSFPLRLPCTFGRNELVAHTIRGWVRNETTFYGPSSSFGSALQFATLL